MLHPNVKKIVSLIARAHKQGDLSGSGSLSIWKNENEKVLKKYLQYSDDCSITQFSHLLQFDIVDNLLLLCYSSKAHNEILRAGWTQPLKDTRGVVYDISGEEVKLVSRGFPKFFNWKETSLQDQESLLDEEMKFFEKKDGHLIEVFFHDGSIKTTTRGKLCTNSAQIAQNLITESQWKQLTSAFPNIMTALFELVGPDARVLVDYPKNSLVLIGMYDSSGEEIPFDTSKMSHLDFELPQFFTSTPRQVLSMLDDPLAEGEGFVALTDSGTRLKFKYRRYIGKMVEEKLSHKYILQRMMSGNLSQMLDTLPEEIHDQTRHVLSSVRYCLDSDTYNSLYSLHNCRDGSREYFRKVARDFWKLFLLNKQGFKNILDSEINKLTSLSPQRDLDISRTQKSSEHVKRTKQHSTPLMPFSA